MGRMGVHLVATVLVLAALLGASSPAGADQIMVRIPKLESVTPADAYAHLHRLGLRVTVPPYWRGLPPEVAASSPAAGTQVRRGAVVRLSLGCPRCGAASPGFPTDVPRYRVRRFVGRLLTVAETWASGKALEFIEHVGPLHAGDAPSFSDNYRVTRQRPPRGAFVGFEKGEDVITSTPLAVWARQTRSFSH